MEVTGHEGKRKPRRTEKKRNSKRKVMGEKDVKSEKETSPSEKRTNGERKTRPAKNDEKQPSILSMFTKLPAKRKNEETSEEKSEESERSGTSKEETAPEEKKIKVDEDVSEKKEDDENSPSKRMLREKPVVAAAVNEKQPPPRCKECRQLLDDSELQLFCGDPENAVEEYIALTDPKLSLLTGDEEEAMSYDERLQFKITHFSVYDKNTHLCPFDTGLIEKNKELFFSGFVKPIYDESPSPEGGIPTKALGPINEWYITGFDGGEKALIGFGTAFAEYILVDPSECYMPFWKSVQEKIYISKIVIEFLQKNVASDYEDLLNHIQTTVPPAECSRFTEDTLLRHAQFVVEQVESYDEAADDDESLLITTPCMRDD
ncbi:DNA (cytosine-5)-methytransferase 1 [Apostichopus japonicus]|uniref:DNA (Cytosine-5)-methytransferase 1 n=1 Tax=Stichopus japonicus TaxID=307972 RepID=A0A2G8KRL0_STIJA|nr:DNA (cytosine-5)-methytransferase 1 [Apostichopus japonicus]